jgi:hypothetical protein
LNQLSTDVASASHAQQLGQFVFMQNMPPHSVDGAGAGLRDLRGMGGHLFVHH